MAIRSPFAMPKRGNNTFGSLASTPPNRGSLGGNAPKKGCLLWPIAKKWRWSGTNATGTDG
jgi:hypothetical protein